MIIERFLQESANAGLTEIEASNEGLLFEQGGFARAIDMALEESFNINNAMMAIECRCCGLLTENAQAEAEQLQEATIKSLFDKLVGLVKSLWKRMLEVMNTVALYFTKFVDEKGFVRRAEEALKNLSDFSGLEFEGYTYTLDAVKPGDVYKKLVKAVISKYDAAKGKTGEEAIKAIEAASNADAMDAYANTGFGCKKSELNDCLFKMLRNGKDKKEKINFSKSDATAAITSFKSAKADVNALRQQINNTHNETISSINKASNEVKSQEKSDTNKMEVKRLSEMAKTIKDMLIWSNTACNAVLTALKEQKSQQKSIITKAISKAKSNAKPKAEEPVKESVDLGDDVLAKYMNM